MNIFLAGVMQGTKKKHGIRSQNYRKLLAQIIIEVVPNAKIIDPDITDPNRLSYTKAQSANMFFRYCETAGNVDLLIAYLPEASMGTAIEMWNAYNSKIPILTISPLNHNWVINLLSTKIFRTMNDFKSNFNSKLLKQLNLFSTYKV